MVTFNAVLGNIWIAIQNQLATVTALKFIDLDTGQLEYKESDMRPSVLLPCALFDFVDDKLESLSYGAQEGEAILEVRIGVDPYTHATQYFTDTQKANALQFFEIENLVNLALHGWCNSQYFSPLQRISMHTEKRNDKLRVRVLRYRFNYLDNSAMPQTTSIVRPDLNLNLSNQGFGIGG